MAEEVRELSALGDSTDWLRDAKGSSLRTLRTAFLEALDQCWCTPRDEKLLNRLTELVTFLFQALEHNKLYPADLVFEGGDRKPRRFLLDPAHLRAEFETIRWHCVTNQFGVGELHLIYLVTLLRHRLTTTTLMAEDLRLLDELGRVVLLTEAEMRARNVAPFSDGLRHRYLALRLLGVIFGFGLADDEHPEAMAKIEPDKLLHLAPDLQDFDQIRQYVDEEHELVFEMLALSLCLRKTAKLISDGGRPDPEALNRTASQLFHADRRLARTESIGRDRRRLLTVSAQSALSPVIPLVNDELGARIYAHLRSSKGKRKCSHRRMFAAAVSDDVRLRLLNFLFKNGGGNPFRYKERFEQYFSAGDLQFINKEKGFTLAERPKE